MSPPRVAALDIGGTHVTAALIDVGAWMVVQSSVCRRSIDSSAHAGAIVDSIVDAATCLAAAEGIRWGVAIPGPFDYERGIGDFRGVGKFDSLRGVDVGAMLRERGVGSGGVIHFLNDANAFGIGEWVAGAARGHARAIAVTLGTGVGSAFVVDGVALHHGPGVPPEGRLDLLQIDGRPLEHTMSRAAIRPRYAAAVDDGSAPDVEDIAVLARAGEAAAHRAIAEPVAALGRLLAPRATAFEAGVIVIGAPSRRPGMSLRVRCVPEWTPGRPAGRAVASSVPLNWSTTPLSSVPPGQLPEAE